MSTAHPYAPAPATSTPPSTATGPAAVAAGMRELTPGEHGHLERLRAHLAASGADVRSSAGLGALLASSYRRWAAAPDGTRPDPSGMLAAIAVGVGDLVLARGGQAGWVLRVAAATPAPALLSVDGSAAVVPFDDVERRWTSTHGADDEAWVERYVAAAAEHLGAGSATPVAPAVPAVPAVPSAHVPQPRGPQAGPDAAPAVVAAPPIATRAPVPAPAPGSAPPSPVSVASSSEPSVPAAPPEATARRERHGRRSASAAVETPTVHYRTPAELPFVPSAELQELALRALDRALASALTDGPTTFAMLDDGTHVRVRHFDGSPEVALAAAEAWLAAERGLRAALSWPVALDPSGAIVVPGLGATGADHDAGSSDRAVVVLASDTARPGLVVAHRWASPDGEIRARAAGVPVIVGPCPPVL
ncbi:hypothetical protein [Cellulomonas composti]|uniref:DUF3806 domain-containing protein n=1 Tax=Cellulomonas composti TaxID=266130 RepID=A0A511JBX7_9CELL|nr:hypothetical protein [Cellulomonas composti]GEL95289.1 hypothetical protein CCO02nite_19470 [Cellulomonas composti]